MADISSLKSMISDAAASYKFYVSIGPVSIGFSRVSGISRQVEIQTYREGGVNDRVHIFPKQTPSESVLVLEKGVFTGVNNPFYAVGEPLGVPVILTTANNTGIPSKTYTFMDCIVKSWTVSEMDAAKNGVLIDKFEVVYGSMTVV